jgi:CHAT domain-containing protein
MSEASSTHSLRTRRAGLVKLIWLTGGIICCSVLSLAQTRPASPADSFRIAQKLIQAEPEERRLLLDEYRDIITAQTRRFILDRGDGLLAAGKYAQALDLFQLALTVAERLDDRAGLAAAHSSLGSVYYFQGDYARALQSYQEARKRYDILGKSREAATAIFNPGLVAKAKGEANAALVFFQQSLAQCEKLGMKEQATDARNYLGTIYLERGDTAAALKLFSDDGEGAANLLKIADALYYQEEYEKALEFYEKALANAQRGPAQALGASVIAATGGIGNSQYALGYYEQALEQYQKLLKLHQQNRDYTGAAAAFLHLGNCLYALGDMESALENYRLGLNLANYIGHATIMAELLAGTGNVFYAQAEPARALEAYQQSLAQFEITGDKGGLRRMLRSAANSHFRLGNYAQSLAAFQKCLAFAEEAGDRNEAADIRLGIGLVHMAESRFAEALENYLRSLAQFEASGNKAQQALALYRIALVRTGQNDYSQALKDAARSATLAAQSDALDTLWRAQFETGRIQKRQDQASEARRAFEQSVATVEKLRARFAIDQDISSDTVLPYLALVSLIAEGQNSLEAFTYAERAKAQALRVLLHNSRTLPVKGLPPAEIAGEQKLRREITAIAARLARIRQRNPKGEAEAVQRRLSEQLSQARANYSAFLNRLYLRHPQLKIHRGEAPALRPEETGRLLADERSALIEYVVSDDATWIFVLTRDKPVKPARSPRATKRTGTAPSQVSLRVGQIQVSAGELMNRALRFRQSIVRREENFSPQARELYELLLKPAETDLRGKTRLTIIPDGVLWALPFAAMQSSADRFLIEERALSFAPSLTALREISKRAAQAPRATKTLLAIVSPATTQKTAPPNPVNSEAEREAQSVQQVYNSGSRILTGLEASKAAVMAEAAHYHLVHFAAPFPISNSRPMYSFLTLAQGGPEQDGRLRLREMISLETKARAMIFSGATIAPDSLRSFNGLSGLAWAAFIAGSPSVITSQWQVSSPSTTELMTGFHQSAAMRQRLTDALQQSALKLRRSDMWGHPYHWAGFISLGASN